MSSAPVVSLRNRSSSETEYSGRRVAREGRRRPRLARRSTVTALMPKASPASSRVRASFGTCCLIWSGLSMP